MDAILNPQLLVPLLFSALAFLTIIGIALPFLRQDPVAERVKLVSERRAVLSSEARERLERQRPTLRSQTTRISLMKAILDRLKLNEMIEQPKLKEKLLQAGWRGPAPRITVIFFRLALPIGFAGAAALLLFGSSNIEMSTGVKLVICLVAGGVGYLMPNIMVANAITKRQGEMLAAFPDALDLMVICIESGLSLEAAFTRVSLELAVDAPVLSQEIGLTSAELAFLGDRNRALVNLSARSGLPAVKSFVTALSQSEKYGTPLGVSLRVVAQENRDTRMSKAEEKAASLPAKLTVPMVLFFLPVVFLVLIGPTVIQAMKAFE